MFLWIRPQIYRAVGKRTLLQLESSFEDPYKFFQSRYLFVTPKRKQTCNNTANQTKSLIFNAGEYNEAALLERYIYILEYGFVINSVGENHFPNI